MRLNALRWHKVLSRWSEIPETPERKLLIAVLASAIEEEQRSNAPDFTDGFFAPGAGFEAYCAVAGLGPQFVREQIARAEAA